MHTPEDVMRHVRTRSKPDPAKEAERKEREEVLAKIREASQRLTVGGRVFVMPAHTSIRQDNYLADLMERVDMDRLEEKVANEESIDHFVKRFVRFLYGTGVLYDVLGGMYMEEGQEKWTEAAAKEHAEFFGNVTDPQEKEQVTAAVVGVVLSFFINGVASSKISLKYSNESTPDAPPSDASIAPEVPSTSDSGTPS